MKVFIVVDKDDHTDDEYHAYQEKESALAKARKCADEAITRYGDMAKYETECDGCGGFWFCEYGEERWEVGVREVELR